MLGSNQPKINVEENMLGRRGWGIMNMKKKKKGLLVLDEWGTRRSRMPVSSKESGSPSHEHPPPFFFFTPSAVLSNLKAC